MPTFREVDLPLACSTVRPLLSKGFLVQTIHSFHMSTIFLFQVQSVFFFDGVYTSLLDEPAAVRAARLRQKKAHQWQRWVTEVIPSLLLPHMELLRLSESLRQNVDIPRACTCGGEHVRTLKVVCVYFESLRYVNINVCLCSPAALQLLSRGLFPCTPQAPTLAVDLNLLRFTQQLFVRLPPNTTSFCATLEAFLGDRGYKLTTRDSLHRRFGNALLWYSNLLNATKRHVQDAVKQARCSVLHEACESTSHIRTPGTYWLNAALLPFPLAIALGLRLFIALRFALTIMLALGFTDALDLGFTDALDLGVTDALDLEVSDALELGVTDALTLGVTNAFAVEAVISRRRWRACWTEQAVHTAGGPAETNPDVIVYIDACFTQKRRRGKGDGHDHPREAEESVFIPEEEVKKMESYVEQIRPSRDTGRRRAQPPISADDNDGYEEGLKVPRSVLDGCHESFLAADEKREKASTQFFSDTGLMALLCRHDRVLWLVNMTSAGEKQHYTLALIQRLFVHLPRSTTIGILYDIACQLHWSCVKWDLLGDLFDRIMFAVSIFHVYGHQWPCQLIYHPRKCIGFGLTDGEGCERFWSSIRKLIPSLRVSGYHQRLFILDAQVKYLDQQSLFSLGHWLNKKWKQCQAKRLVAAEAVEQCGITDEVLREQWAAQVRDQTKPAPRRSRDKGKKAIQTILALQKMLGAYNESVRLLELKLLGDDDDIFSIEEVSLKLMEARSKVVNVKQALQRKKTALGVGERLQLSHLINNAFLRLRMNAHAVKQHIRDRLHQRKFELERLERSYRQTVNNNKLSSHAESSIKRREPGILKLAKTYNDLCKQMDLLIKQRKAPRYAVSLQPIQGNGLFKLDIDDDIWQDVGLDDDDDIAAVPRWLGDETVREGIKNRLLLDRCNEEEERLREERCSLQEWFAEE
ncbi:hypothetical protein SCP_0212700 [Sparassis crispa]|uniref:CxC1-like cysteine cluster associated with KDZ transposases domain-containing protein n=1 Tax=Sparassis crispa TaxID=139825 RepID=A0A401GD26_9APHY|nr:hypothetical protein SCP_0212700 [Sparassis crispa]GBE80067.1 hypothetical protein SCP_0212700 [Sparassis crispa]